MFSHEKLEKTGEIITAGMIQRINLLRFVSKSPKIVLPFIQILQACVFLLIILIGYSLSGCWEKVTLAKHIAQLQSQSKALIEKTGSDRMRKMLEITGNDKLYTALRMQYLKNAPGFSRYLEAIADECPPGVWLTSIEIDKRNNKVLLMGNAYYSSHVTKFIDNLNNEKLFINTSFFLAKIDMVGGKKRTDQADKTLPLYQFVLQTAGVSK